MPLKPDTFLWWRQPCGGLSRPQRFVIATAHRRRHALLMPGCAPAELPDYGQSDACIPAIT